MGSFSMAGEKSGLTPDYETSQSIYDIDNDFFALSLGPRWAIPALISIATT
jgi:cyclopropane fatty-acyl-phospholipid synthase-like methyltransferase